MRRATPSRFVLGFYLCAFLILASGRLGSMDAGAELQAAMLAATSRRLLSPTSLGIGWYETPGGEYCETHDIGNVLLMVPAAALGHILSRAPEQDVLTPPVPSRFLVSLTYAVICGWACWLLYRLLAQSMPPRTAFLLSAAFAFTTPFVAYAKTAWDVLGCCCAMIALLYGNARMVSGRASSAAGWLTGAAWGAVAAFRYSAAPFAAASVALALYGRRDRLTRAQITSCLAGAIVTLAPTLWYNALRTGSILRPGLALPVPLSTGNAFSGDVVHGLAGLLVSPNFGLFVFAPVCLLVALVPAVWHRLDPDVRLIVWTFGAGAAGYLVLVSALEHWNANFGWGPRYLVPVLPIAFYASAVAMVAASPRAQTVAAVLIALTAAVNVPAALVSWSTALAAAPESLDKGMRGPMQQTLVYRALARGVTGRPPLVAPATFADPERVQAASFPDFWIARAVQRGALGAVAGLTALVVLGVGAAWCGVGLWRGFDDDH